MKHLRLLIPIPVFITTIIIIENYFFDYHLEAGIILKTASLIFYLRLDRKGTPLLNTLSALVVLMGVGEYVLLIEPPIGKIVLIVSVAAFGLMFFFRQKLKEAKDPLSQQKSVFVLIFVLAEVYSVNNSSKPSIALLVSFVLLGGLYLYDRMVMDPTIGK